MKLSDTKTLNTAEGPCPFTVTQLPAMQSGKLLVRLGKSLGPGLAALAGATASKGSDVAGLSQAVQDLFAGLTETEYEYVTRALLNGCTVQVRGESVPVLPIYDTLMQGHIAEALALLWFALQVNYGNFTVALAGLGLKMPAGLTKAAGLKSSPTP